MVLAPEHPLVGKLTTEEQNSAVEDYKQKSAAKSDLERTDLNKEKSGVFIGAYAINPANGQKIPIWIADYVLINYGTGAIMSVPSHDERDFEFATRFNLPITSVFDPDLSKSKGEASDNNGEKDLRLKIIEGKSCWTGEGTYINSSSDQFSLNGVKDLEEAKKIVYAWLDLSQKGKKTTNYKLRDWLFSRQRYWGEPFPILHFADGTKRALEIDELPLCPPEVESYKPAEDGNSPLASVKEWMEVVDPKTGKAAHRESNTMPQWAGSCWYYLRFCDPANDTEAWSKEADNYWMPVDLYIGGAEHAVLHLLYARFWHKVFYDCGLVKNVEPFQKLTNQGMILSRSYQRSNGTYVEPSNVKEKNGEYIEVATGEKLFSQIEKMSKSKLNGKTPDEVIEEFGADSLRLYDMFMGPLEKEKIWNTDAVSGCRRFLARFYELAFSEKLVDEESQEALKLGHRLIHGVSADIENLMFNTAIAKMMEFMNDFTKLEAYPKSVVKMVTQALMPFAPHLAEEVWHLIGCREPLSYAAWPQVDESFLVDATATYVVQVNGKVRGKFDLPKDQSEEAILSLATQNPHILKFIDGKDIQKVVFVPNKLLSIVTAS